jgi:hypothetical protein
MHEINEIAQFQVCISFELPRSNRWYTTFENGISGTETCHQTSGTTVLKHPCLACHVIAPLGGHFTCRLLGFGIWALGLGFLIFIQGSGHQFAKYWGYALQCQSARIWHAHIGVI